MKIEIDIHPVQAKIIATLSRRGRCHFSEMNTDNLPNDWFSFHVRRLLRLSLIAKDADGAYSLTDEGKSLYLSIDPEKNSIRRPSKISILIMCKIDERYIIQRRLIEPFYGYYEFMACRASWGKSLLRTGKETFLRETGVEVDLVFKGIDHKTDHTENGEVLDDKYFFVFAGECTRGDLKPAFENGENFLLRKDEILKLEKTHYDLRSTFAIYESHVPLFTEIEGIPKDY